MAGNYSIYGDTGASQYGSQLPSNSSSFWSDWKKTIMSNQSGSGSGGVGSKIGSAAGGAIGTAVGGPVGGAIGSQLGSMAGDFVEGGIGGDESGQSKLDREQAQSEKETRRWEERNSAPTSGIGQYLARDMMTQGMPVLNMLNKLEFVYNKVLPFMGDYGGLQGKNLSKQLNMGSRNIGNYFGNIFNKMKRR